jgi:hypothetical protein
MGHENILEESDPTDTELSKAGGLGTEIADLLKEFGLEIEIPELRGHDVRSVDFEG